MIDSGYSKSAQVVRSQAKPLKINDAVFTIKTKYEFWIVKWHHLSLLL
jgi:hypothetical protein